MRLSRRSLGVVGSVLMELPESGVSFAGSVSVSALSGLPVRAAEWGRHRARVCAAEYARGNRAAMRVGALARGPACGFRMELPADLAVGVCLISCLPGRLGACVCVRESVCAAVRACSVALLASTRLSLVGPVAQYFEFVLQSCRLSSF